MNEDFEIDFCQYFSDKIVVDFSLKKNMNFMFFFTWHITNSTLWTFVVL